MKKLNLGKGLRLSTIAVFAVVFGLIMAINTSEATNALDKPVTTVRHLVTSGEAVDTGWADELTQAFFLAAVDTTGRTSTAYITYSGVAFDPASKVCSADPLLGTYCRYTRVTYDSVSADINPRDITITGNTARLNTNLAEASNVVFSRCVYEDAVGNTVCTDMLPTGLISLQWQKTMTDSVKSLGITETKTGSQTVRIAGTRSQFSADTTGTILGTLVQHRQGNIGTNKAVSIDILRTP
jgi:hypothetical protein